jgi:hypothetical protein
VERTGDYEWRGEGEEAELVLYASEASAFDRLTVAGYLPDARNPVYGAAAGGEPGWVVASESHVSPDLVSVPLFGLLLIADSPMSSLGVEPRDFPRLLSRNLSEVRPPSLGGAEARAACESGAMWAAGEELLEEEDLALFPRADGASEALGRRALSAGSYEIGEVTADIAAYGTREEDEEIEVPAGALLFVVRAGCGEAGRLALSAHREHVAAGEFDSPGGLRIAPLWSREAEDFGVALGSLSNLAAARTAVSLYVLRRALAGMAGELRPLAVWGSGGLEARGEERLHRSRLAAVGEGEIFVCGGQIATGTGDMMDSVPEFGAPEEWEEAGLLERRLELSPLG